MSLYLKAMKPCRFLLLMEKIYLLLMGYNFRISCFMSSSCSLKNFQEAMAVILRIKITELLSRGIARFFVNAVVINAVPISTIAKFFLLSV